MSKFYGGGARERSTTSVCANQYRAEQRSALPASTYQGPSREGVSGERQSPDSGNWHPYTREELAFADAYAREQMQDGLTPEAG